MCNRFRYAKDIEDLAEHFPELQDLRIAPRYNVAPTQDAPVVVLRDGEATLEMMRWGIVPPWSKHARSAGALMNARSETAPTKPAFRDAFRHRRALVIAHGFYEWQTLPHFKQPWHFHRKNDALMCFAGLWEPWQPSQPAPGTAQNAFTILTCPSNPLVARFHDRMPVMLKAGAWDTWLDESMRPESLAHLLAPFDPDDMEAWPVTPRMNSSRFESPECVRPVVPDDLELKLE